MKPKTCEIETLRKSVARLEEPSGRVDDMIEAQVCLCRMVTYEEIEQLICMFPHAPTSRIGHCRADGVASLDRRHGVPQPRTETQKPAGAAARHHPIGSRYVGGTPV